MRPHADLVAPSREDNPASEPDDGLPRGTERWPAGDLQVTRADQHKSGWTADVAVHASRPLINGSRPVDRDPERRSAVGSQNGTIARWPPTN